jgi:hypothetical protein
MLHTGGPAFPTGTGVTPYNSGMTLRDYFAAKAMQGILFGYTQGVLPPTESLAPASYKIADAMLEARQKK